ncbi:hypothetical protein [Candidatus Viridilinea mediisalina]|uniref:NADPH-dependent FMN reductase-like domain-containing protein n=1 Tax=Candidatus Viridilinea mediisalina TaxID=2024553 RepID=A0A2A6RFN8_9CHLR|nr:hypothetical protein [Candidatus Viridilinea mediisalina]PDW01944.1 hypothetical protein CJ255_16510 [Candidatus Viridilinea mediisalina]
MHDGYLYTLGICGSAAGSGPAPECLSMMLAALPPVKRAAFLGEVLLNQAGPSLADPLRDPLYHELADAEVLLLVTPLLGGALPARLSALATLLIQKPLPKAPAYAVLVSFNDQPRVGLALLQRALTTNGIELLHELSVPNEADLVAFGLTAIAAAQQAYGRARLLYPEALP